MSDTQYRETDWVTDTEELSREIERDSRRYNKAFTEEEEARLN